MISLYVELFKLNHQLIAEYMKRSQNHQALLLALKEVNQTIAKAANLRYGPTAKSRVITECRQAIKKNQALQSLVSIMMGGGGGGA